MKRSNKHPLRNFFGSRLFLIGMFVLALLVALGFARAYYSDYKVRQEIEALQQEVGRLEKKKFESIKLLDYVTSEEFVEEKARTELNLKKEGEHVVILQGSESNSASTSVDGSVAGADLNNIVKWWYYFTRHSLPN